MPRLTDEQRLVMEGLIACARGTDSYLNDYDALRAALLRCDEADKMETRIAELERQLEVEKRDADWRVHDATSKVH